ncbi:MAG TPA: hypothetical protein VHS74_02655 [Solirubrobacterales bacterium]|jgi:hypothetical protein|nr:hypothetical protein [Solirubrobacterales bacterium]
MSERRQPLVDPVEEGREIGAAAVERGVELKITGGVAVAINCPSAGRPPLARQYADIDLVGLASRTAEITGVLEDLGYVADVAFNALHGASRLFFWDETNERQVDVFLDRVEMCHEIDLRKRLGSPKPTLDLADLLLMKLQIFETNEKDYLDILSLLTDHEFGTGPGEIDLPYLAGLAGEDWGLWRTTTMVAERAVDFASALAGLEATERVRRQVALYLDSLEAEPKSRGWKFRAKIGERKRWYELPEESH